MNLMNRRIRLEWFNWSVVEQNWQLTHICETDKRSKLRQKKSALGRWK